jgi:hypothetical protein
MARSRVNFTFTFELIRLTEYYAREQHLLIIELENYNRSANFSKKIMLVEMFLYSLDHI